MQKACRGDETGKRNLLSHAVPRSKIPTRVIHSMSQEVLVVFPIALAELLRGGDEFHGWHRGKSQVDTDKEKQLSETLGREQSLKN